MNNQTVLNTQQPAADAQPLDLIANYSWTYFAINSVLLIAIIVCAILSVIYSFRYRRAKDAAMRGLLQAKMNISMGVTLVGIALIQIFLFESSWLRAIIGAVFLVMGLFNMFAGIRNRRLFSNLINSGKQPE